MIRAMVGTLDALFAATALFVCGHFLLSSQSIRRFLMDKLGEQGFRGGYALAIGAAFVWMLFAYGAAPYVELWPYIPALAWVPVVVMPVSLLLVVCGLSTPNPTSVGGEKILTQEVHDQSPGMLRVTRHPFLWGTALWAVAHVVVNGDVASLILMGGVLVLSLGGMWHIDQRREEDLGSAWGPIAMTTSRLPFQALLQGRTTMDWKGVGWSRLVAALALYVILLHVHDWIIGVSALPV